MASPSDLVVSQFSLAKTYASAAQSQLTVFTNAMAAAAEDYVAPQIDIQWVSIPAPPIPGMPTIPTLPTISFNTVTAPTAFADSAPTITLDEFTEIAPTTTFPTAPVLSYGVAPTVPAVGAVTVPDAPTVATVAVPTYMALSVPTFGGLDLHETWLDNLDTIPTLTLVEPTPYSYNPGPKYASTLLENLKATLNARIAGGTGLDPTVEAAIWNRAQSRETQLALANEVEVMRNAEALGFTLPAGVLAAQLREAQGETYDKLSTFSRDVAIKQAELEQANLKDTIAAGMQMESQLIDYSFKLESLAFESSKAAAENALGVYNAQVEGYKALLTAYELYATVYKTIIDGELAKVEVYKAQISAEQAKADLNKTLVDQYKAQIEASLSVVEVYKAQVSGAQTLIQLEQTKISAAGEQIKGYVATVNAETAKIEAYKAGVQAESAKVDVYKVKADVFASRVQAQSEEARLRLGEYTAKAQVKSQEWDGYRSRVEAERSRMQALASQSSSLTDGFRAAAAATEASAGAAARQWETQIKQYEAGLSIALTTAKANNEQIQDAAKVRIDIAKIGAQVYAQLASSSYTMANATASVSGTGGTSVSYNYSNSTSNQPAGLESF